MAMSGDRIDARQPWTLVEAWIGSARLDRAADYLRRGRRFADRKTYEIKLDWRDRRAPLDAGTVADLEAELALRGEGTPRPRTRDGIGRHWHECLRERMMADPATWGSIERDAYAAALAFDRYRREAVKH